VSPRTGLIVISIYDHESPIEELVRCYALHRLAYFPSDPTNLVPIVPELALELKRLMAARGFYRGKLDDGGTRPSRGAWISSSAVRTTTTASTTAGCSTWKFSPTSASGTATRPMD
jgi:hypothetical protein